MMKNVFLCLTLVSFCVVASFGMASAETLALLTWKGYAPKVLIEKFKAETGIDVKVT